MRPKNRITYFMFTNYYIFIYVTCLDKAISFAGKHERPAAKDCVFALHRAIRGASRINGTDHVYQTEIRSRQ